jgi:hypothetical protein
MATRFNNPFEINDFSGGISDDVWGQSPNNTCESLNNFNIDSEGHPITREGSSLDDTDNPQIPSGVERVGTLINYDNDTELFVQSETELYFRDPSAYTELVGPVDSNNVFSAGSSTSVISHAQWNGHLYLTSDDFPRPMKVYADSGGTNQVRTSGLPKLASNPTATPTVTGAESYLYAFHYEFTYTVGDRTFQDVGAITQIQITDGHADPSAQQHDIAAIPVIANGADDNWDTATMKVFIYRSISGGTTLYKLGEVTNGTTTFTDNFADASITSNLILYNNDGTFDFDPVPLSKYIHIINNTGYYAHTKDSSDTFKNRVRQSRPGDPDSCPESFFSDVEDEITGISSVQSIPVVFCKRHVYRIEGSIDQFGRGDMNFIRISDHAGCISNSSIVQAEQKLIWAGNDGFYQTDGYNVSKISDHLNTRYKGVIDSLTQSNRIIGRFDETERRIFWTIQQDSASLDNDSVIVLDLRWGLRPSSSFYTWGGDTFRATCIEFFDGKLYRGDTRGYVFKHDSAVDTDAKVDQLVAESAWDKETIIWTMQSININFDGTYFRKYPTRILLTAANEGNTTVQISSIDDGGRKTRNCNVIRWRKNFVWGSEIFTWGDPDCVWGPSGLIEQWRRFPSRGLRISYQQIVVTNGLSIVINSDDYGEAVFDAVANTATLVDTAGSDWPTDVVDYFIATSNDSYVETFLITTRNTSEVITVADPNETFPTGTLPWVISGYRKGEKLRLLAYNINWKQISTSQKTFATGDGGGNA